MPKPLAAIVRVSHMGDRRAGSESFHADRDQVESVKRYAKSIGAKVEFLEPELSVSGGKPISERPALRAAIEGVERGRYGGIVVAYLSRLTRSRSGIEIWERVEAAGGHVHCAAENLDTSTPSGRFVRDIHLANAVREREEHVDRFEVRREKATEAGIWQRRQTPKGYNRDPETRRLVPNADAKLVRWAFRVVGSKPMTEIAERLGMTTSGIRHLLKNRVYLGELRVGTHVNPAAHPPLIDVETWNAAQRGRPRPGRRVDRAPALLVGLVRCARCGHAMTRTHAANVNYTCHGRASGARCPRPAAIGEQILDTYVWPIVVSELDRLYVRAAESGGAVTAARDRLARASAERAAFLEAVSAAEIGIDAYAAGARSRQAEVEQAEGDLQQALAAHQLPPQFSSGAEVLASLDAHGRNRLLRALLEAVVVFPAGRGRRVPTGERVRVLKFGAGLIPVKRGEAPYGLRPLPLLDLDDERVLWVAHGEDPL